MRGLLAIVVIMGVLIVAGVAILAATIVHRLSGSSVAQAAVTLVEPPGTHMQSIASAGDRLAILLTGGGPDRVVLVDPRTGTATAHIALVP